MEAYQGYQNIKKDDNQKRLELSAKVTDSIVFGGIAAAIVFFMKAPATPPHVKMVSVFLATIMGLGSAASAETENDMKNKRQPWEHEGEKFTFHNKAKNIHKGGLVFQKGFQKSRCLDGKPQEICLFNTRQKPFLRLSSQKMSVVSKK